MKGTHIKNRLKRLVASAIAAVTMVTTLSFGASAQTFDTKYGTKNIEGESWMSNLPDDMKISDMSIPGAHDATTRNVGEIMEPFAQTQRSYVGDLLIDGVRYFDLRIYKNNDTLYMCHGDIDCKDLYNNKLTLDSVIDSMRDFLKKNPSETIILQVKCDRSDKYAEYETFKYFRTMAENGELYCGDHAPTLGEARGKFLFFGRLGSHEVCGPTEEQAYKITKENGSAQYWGIDVLTFTGGDTNKKTMGLTAKNDEQGYCVWTEDMYDVPRADKWDYVYNSLMGPDNAAARRDEAKEKGQTAFNIIYASMSYQNWCEVALRLANPFYGLISDNDGMVWPSEGANYINPRLKDLLKSNPDLYTGFLVCDFIDGTLAQDIYMTNFNVTDGYTGSW